MGLFSYLAFGDLQSEANGQCEPYAYGLALLFARNELRQLLNDTYCFLVTMGFKALGNLNVTHRAILQHYKL